MTIVAKAYANKKAKDGKPNRVNLMMSLEEAKSLAAKDKETVAALFKALAETVK